MSGIDTLFYFSATRRLAEARKKRRQIAEGEGRGELEHPGVAQ